MSRFLKENVKISQRKQFWPDRDDLQNVNHEFILKIGLVPECTSSGRLWKFPSFAEIENLYEKFSSIYF